MPVDIQGHVRTHGGSDMSVDMFMLGHEIDERRLHRTRGQDNNT